MAGSRPDLEDLCAVGGDRRDVGSDPLDERAGQEPAQGVVEARIADEDASWHPVPLSGPTAVSHDGGHGGRLADLLGRRRTFLAGLGVFTAASLTAGLAGDGSVLIAARAAQGVGAALLSPSALSIITTTFHGGERRRALGAWAALPGAGAAVGVLVGGLLVSGPGWQWVFSVNVPVGVLVAAAVPTTVAASPRQAAARVDVPGALLVTAGTGLLIYGLVEAGDRGWGAATTLGPLAAGLALLGGFAVVERMVAAPLVDLRLLATRPVVAGSAVAAGFALAAIGMALLGGISAGDDAVTGVLPGCLLAAAGLGMAFVTATTTGPVPHRSAARGPVSGVVTTAHELGAALGVAIASTLAGTSVDGGSAATSAVVAGFGDAFLAGAILAGLAAVATSRLLPPGRPPATDGPCSPTDP